VTMSPKAAAAIIIKTKPSLESIEMCREEANLDLESKLVLPDVEYPAQGGNAEAQKFESRRISDSQGVVTRGLLLVEYSRR